MLPTDRPLLERRRGARCVLLMAAVLTITIASPAAVAQEPPGKPLPDADGVVRERAARSASWITPTAPLETLEYDFVSGPDVTAVKVTRGERRRYSVWMGATLHAGFRELMRSPGRFNVRVEREAGAATFKLHARVNDDKEPIRVEAGNGVDGSWRGYFSHPGREATIVVDAGRLVPLEERVGPTTILYSDWREAGAGRWVPLRVDVVGSSARY